MSKEIVKSGGRDCGATLYAKRISQGGWNGFEVVLVVTHHEATR